MMTSLQAEVKETLELLNYRAKGDDAKIAWMRDAEQVILARIERHVAPIEAERDALKATVAELVLALDVCQKESWWSENDRPSRANLIHRLHVILGVTRAVLIERRFVAAIARAKGETQ